MNRISYASVGFFVHTAELCNHYKSLWRLMGGNHFDVILHGPNAEKNETKAIVESLGYRCFCSEKIIEDGYQYEVVISNLSMHVHQSRPISHVLGKRSVRFMYALGKAKHNFADWNAHYDLILCYGPWQAERMKSCCDAVTFQMGYPRYDDYFNVSASSQAVVFPLAKLLDSSKKTILWLPTWRELSSLNNFSDVMGSLCESYNVIVKTHPLIAAREPSKLRVLKPYNFHSVITHSFDNLELFRLADMVVCDYGGTAFGAIYLDKPLLLLNLPDAEKDSLVGEDSPDLTLRQEIINFDIKDRWQLQDAIETEDVWLKQAENRRRLRDEYFFPSYGFSAEMAYFAIKNIEHILKQAGKR
uniref:CDP-glycerol glycerophosphotransferase family protein n=1 Tax=Shewanella baltica TaxID=62322 RepID=UPI004048548F